MNAELARDEKLLENGELEVEEFVDRHFDALYERHISDMPYGTAKARTGDPREWIYYHYQDKYFVD